MFYLIEDWLKYLGVSETYLEITSFGVFLSGLMIVCFLANLMAKRYILGVVKLFISRSKNQWDDVFLNRKVFNNLSHLAPALVVYFAGGIQFPPGWDSFRMVLIRGSLAYMIIAGWRVINSLLDATAEIYEQHEIARDRPIKGYLQALRIIVTIILGILVIAVLINRSPLVFLSGVGAVTAILLLVFKDAILGFVAGIQLAGNDLVRRGDWISMPKYHADGDVIDVALTTIKVQNWDKSITSIPIYAFVSDSFTNWRGMEEAEGRRIKRAIHIDMTSIAFCDESQLESFSQTPLLVDYIARKREEIEAFNSKHNMKPDREINSRRLTNIGTFRKYVEAYLRSLDQIHQEMTLLVRQLAPNEHGLPIEIYVFSRDKRWANYEAIQADIFDHLLAVLPKFGLRVFQSPSSNDLRAVLGALASVTKARGLPDGKPTVSPVEGD